MPKTQFPLPEEDAWKEENNHRFSREYLIGENERLKNYIEGLKDGVSLTIQAVFKEISQNENK